MARIEIPQYASILNFDYPSLAICCSLQTCINIPMLNGMPLSWWNEGGGTFINTNSNCIALLPIWRECRLQLEFREVITPMKLASLIGWSIPLPMWTSHNQALSKERPWINANVFTLRIRGNHLHHPPHIHNGGRQQKSLGFSNLSRTLKSDWITD